MNLQINNGRVSGVRWVAANSSGGPLKPELIILHDTAGALRKFSSVEWFASKQCTTSAHFVVERDGTITQMVRTDRRAWHAGKSEWKGRKLCNSFSVGIEIVNPGRLTKDGRADFGPIGHPGPFELRSTHEHGTGYWLAYTPEQIDAVKRLCRAIVAEYPDCNAITTHWAVSPGRKIDTGPLFPLEEVQAFAFGEGEPDTIDVPPVAITPPAAPPASMAQSTEGNTALGVGTAGTLNTGVEISGAVSRAAASPRGFSVTEVLIQLAASPTFWFGVFTMLGAAYLWLRRRHRLITQGV